MKQKKLQVVRYDILTIPVYATFVRDDDNDDIDGDNDNINTR